MLAAGLLQLAGRFEAIDNTDAGNTVSMSRQNVLATVTNEGHSDLLLRGLQAPLAQRLCNHKGLAKTSATPGKTLLINHFIINNDWYLVDLPVYGFAKRSKTVQKKLDQMITSYILQRQQLVNTFVLIDIRHDPMKIDTDFINWLGESSVPFSIIFTKAD